MVPVFNESFEIFSEKTTIIAKLMLHYMFRYLRIIPSKQNHKQQFLCITGNTILDTIKQGVSVVINNNTSCCLPSHLDTFITDNGCYFKHLWTLSI